jgi:hypothetical protein
MKFPWSQPEPKKKKLVRVHEVCFGGSLYYEVTVDGQGILIDPQRRFWENKEDAIKVARTIASKPINTPWGYVSTREIYTEELWPTN